MPVDDSNENRGWAGAISVDSNHGYTLNFKLHLHITRQTTVLLSPTGLHFHIEAEFDF